MRAKPIPPDIFAIAVALRVNDAAQFLGISRSKLYQLLKEGKLNSYRPELVSDTKTNLVAGAPLTRRLNRYFLSMAGFLGEVFLRFFMIFTLANVSGFPRPGPSRNICPTPRGGP
jgi:hypothetical protein